MSDSSKQPGDGGRQSFFMTLLAAGAFVFILILIFFLAERVASISETLEHSPPETQAYGGNSFGIDMADGQTVYVPVYSHIYTGGGSPLLLETTLSIRNTDPTHSISLVAVNYYDTQGKLVENYIDGRAELGPLQTVEFLVKKQDKRGGSGANFIVKWEAGEPAYEPLMQAVMVGTSAGQSVSFATLGRPLVRPEESMETAQ